MSQILTVIIDVGSDGRIAVNWFESDGLTDKVALAAVEAVQRILARRAIRAELEAEKKADSDAAASQAPVLDG